MLDYALEALAILEACERGMMCIRLVLYFSLQLVGVFGLHALNEVDNGNHSIVLGELPDVRLELPLLTWVAIFCRVDLV